MLKTLIFLTALGLSQATSRRLTVPHPDCPPGGHYLLPHEYDCARFYYCENGQKFIEPRVCAPGTEFSYHLQVCIHPILANCSLPGAPSSTTQGSTGLPTDSTTQSPTQGPTAGPTTTSPNPGPTAGPTAGPTTTSPNPGPTASPTAGPTTTSPNPGPTASPTASPTTAPNPGPTAGPSSPVAPTQGPDNTPGPDCEFFDNGCPVDFDLFYLLPHETSCRTYYQCVWGEKVERRCPPGTHFNVILQRCDWPYLVDRTCEDDSSPQVSSETVEDIEIEFGPNGCPVNYNISWYLPHEHYCNLYYQCVFGEYIERRCANGTQFNPVDQTCDHAVSANCNLPGGNAPYTTTTTTTSTTTPRPPIDFLPNGCPENGLIDWLLPHEDDCGKYYQCVWGGLIERDCPGNLHFSPTLQICTNPSIAGCLECDTCNNCGGDSSEECPGTTTTTTSTSTTTTTPSTPTTTPSTPTIPPSTTTTATPPSTTTSTTTSTPTTPPNGPSTTDSNESIDPPPPGDRSSESGSGSYETERPPGSSCEDCTEEVVDSRCEEECHVFPWAHEDCDKYWICDGQKPALIVCSEGLHFNPKTGTCDFACNAGCVRERIQATAGYDGLKVFLPWNKIDDNTKSLLKLIAV